MGAEEGADGPGNAANGGLLTCERRAASGERRAWIGEQRAWIGEQGAVKLVCRVCLGCEIINNQSS